MKTDILRFLTEDLLSGQSNDVQSDEDLLSAEIIDSMGVMRLIGFVEERSGLKIPPEDVTIENFQSVDAICNYLDRRGAATRAEQS